jgi:hypothetical protein
MVVPSSFTPKITDLRGVTYVNWCLFKVIKNIKYEIFIEIIFFYFLFFQYGGLY